MRPSKCIVVDSCDTRLELGFGQPQRKDFFYYSPINPRLPLNATHILDYVQWQVNTVRNARVRDLQWALLRHFRDCQEYA